MPALEVQRRREIEKARKGTLTPRSPAVRDAGFWRRAILEAESDEHCHLLSDLVSDEYDRMIAKAAR